MPHRPADSRLLSNLLSHEKDYVRSLHSQLDHGQSSLSSFSAYAAASPPPASRAIGSVATALVGAHDALRNYVLAVEEWCERLKMLKEMEEEVGTIARDREILVDRLIKASKSNNPKRRSLLPSSTSSSHNVSAMSMSNSTLEQLSFSNSKLNLAQSELQACETHLTEKERMLVQMRENALVGGLKARCKALVECGWKWAEVGKAGLKALDSSVISGGSPDRHGLHLQKPLPDIHSPYNRPSSDLSSSIAPSQSASQIFHVDVTSEQYHPSSGSSSIPTAHGSAPEADIHDSSRFALNLPPAHAISEEDHYTPPQVRAPPEEEELGGSSAEEETDERQLEVHENPLFSQQPTPNAKSKRIGSKKKPKRLNSDSAAIMPTSVSAPLPNGSPSKVTFKQQNNDHFGTASSTNTYSDSQTDSSRRRKRSTFLGLGALTGLFHKRERTTSLSGLPSSASLPSQVPPSPSKKGGHWLTRTDKNLKKAGRGGDSSDEEVERPAPPMSPLPSFITQPTPHSAQLARAGGEESPKRARTNGKKLRKVSDGDTQRKASTTDAPNALKVNTGVKRAGSQKGQAISLNGDLPRSQSIGNGHTLSPLSASVSRSSTVRSGSSVRPASLDLPSSGNRGRNPGVSSDLGRPSSPNKAQRRRTSVGSATSPPTRGQASLLSIVEGVARQNRQGWLQSNPNSLLVEVKAPKSVVYTESEGISSSPTHMGGSDTTFTRSDSRRESPLRSPIVNAYRNSIPSSSSEPSLPLKKLPATPGPKIPLRSALRNRTPSPNQAAMSIPRSASPIRGAEAISPIGSVNPLPPVLERGSTESSSARDADSVSLSSAYETGQEDLDDGPPTPRPEEDHTLTNGFAIEPKSNESQLSASVSSNGGTATPPSRRKSVRVSLKPTFSPTPPALVDDEEDHSPWAPSSASTKGQNGENGWASRISENTGWEDSSDEDEDYARARQMLQKATRKLEKASKGEV